MASLSILDVHPGDDPPSASLAQTLVFAFATGEVGDALERALAEVPLGPSAWRADDFVPDVFLPELIARCFRVTALGKPLPLSVPLLQRLLSSPPASLETTLFRQGIFVELVAHAGLRASLHALLVALSNLRALLGKSGGPRIDAIERRLAVLRSLRDIVLLAASGFREATSGLSRIHLWAEQTRREPAYLRLLDLLAYEGGRAELDVRLRLGSDGKIRDFEVLAGRVAKENAFHRTGFQRLLTKASLFLQGHRVGERELLARLVDDVFDGLVPLLPPLFALTAGVELYAAGLAFREAALRAGLNVSLPTFASDTGHVVDDLWNPLLWPEEEDARGQGARLVPSSLDVPAPGARVVVTGPNSGGKTRLLQAVALTQIFAQAGLFVPASRAHLPWAKGLFVSLVEHARFDQSEGKLGTELVRIRRLFESLDEGSLVILDELCSGTNPDEGEDIFRLVVKLLRELRPEVFITTHFLRFAARLEEEQRHAGAAEGLTFLQVELDAADNPTFQFVPGVATTSLARRTAERLGVTEDALRAAMLRRRR